ncbi:MAG: hypothetical protein ABI601_11585 [bacterium]
MTSARTMPHVVRDASIVPYAEFAPPPDLAGVVACTWIACTPVGAPSPGPIIPDACSDIVVVGRSAPHAD